MLRFKWLFWTEKNIVLISSRTYKGRVNLLINFCVIHKMCYFQSNVIYITFYNFFLKIVFFNESFNFWKKTKNIKKLPIIQWIIFSFLFKTIITWIDCFIEIILKNIKWNFSTLYLFLFFFSLIKDIQIRLTVDEWMKKLNEKDWWKEQSEYLTKIKWLIRMI